MKPKNVRTLVTTSWIGIYFGIVGCLLGFKAMGMPWWGVGVGVIVTAGLVMFIGCRQISELYDDSSESPNP